MTDNWQEKITRLRKQTRELQETLDGDIAHPEQLAGANRLRLRLKAFLVDAADIPLRLKALLSAVSVLPPCGLIVLAKNGEILHFDERIMMLLGVAPTKSILKNGQLDIKFLNAADKDTPIDESELPWNKEFGDDDEIATGRIYLHSPGRPDEWSSVVDERRIAATSRNISENPDDEICLVAELHGISTGKVEKTAEKEAEKTAQNKIIGFASVVPKNNELRAVYVSPELVGEGLGAQILAFVERVACKAGVRELNLDASLNAEGFYLRHG